MFQFPGLASPLREMIGLTTDRVAPFGNPGITACLQLPQAYRSLPRPSSPPCAKASTVRPYALDLSVSVRFLNTTTHTRQFSKSGARDSGLGARNNTSRIPNPESQIPNGQAWKVRATNSGAFRSPPLRTGRTRRSRKEVIQPQVPLRLPCYDFAPVTELTLDGCPLAVGPPVSGPSGFHGVTGGVYKARERIHRGVADPRLLAIPASCSRVADCNPNLARLLAIGSPSRVGDALYQAL